MKYFINVDVNSPEYGWIYVHNSEQHQAQGDEITVVNEMVPGEPFSMKEEALLEIDRNEYKRIAEATGRGEDCTTFVAGILIKRYPRKLHADCLKRIWPMKTACCGAPHISHQEVAEIESGWLKFHSYPAQVQDSLWESIGAPELDSIMPAIELFGRTMGLTNREAAGVFFMTLLYRYEELEH